MSTNSIGPAGVTIQTFSDIVNEILYGAGGYPGLLTIYGPGLSVDPNSPDGQMVQIYAQGKIDVLELLQNINANFDPDESEGLQLDQRCAINGVVRMPGTYTQQEIAVTVSEALTLPGLDLYPASPFTVADAQGNRYQLVATYSFLTGGTNTLLFQASVLGAVQSAPNTITVPVTIIAGVTAVNNPTGPFDLGQAEEGDPALRIRRANSVSLPSKGWLQGMYAGLLAIDGVTQAVVFENQTSYVNGYGMPPHSMWIIVAGDPNVAQVAEAIYAKRNACVDWMNGGINGAGTVTLSGSGIGSIAVANAGQGYDNPPTVKIVGTGTGATAHATVSGGAITAFVVDTAGTGYTGTPTVVLNPQTVAFDITQLDGSTFIVYYDTPITQPLWFRATLTAITGSIDKTAIKNQVFAQFANSYGINQQADTASIIAFIKSIAPNASVSSEGVSLDGSTYTSLVAPTNVNYQFEIPSLSNVTIS